MIKKTANITLKFEYNLTGSIDKAAIANFVSHIRSFNENQIILEEDCEGEKFGLKATEDCSSYRSKITFKTFDEFLTKYGKFLNTYDIIHVLEDYARCTEVTCNTTEAEVPDPTN